MLLMFLQEFLLRCSAPNNGRIHTDIPTDKSCNDEHTVKSRGWLNWLSRGMLGAGGTDDSSQFSGVVSYDVKVPVLSYLLNSSHMSRVGLFFVLVFVCALVGKTMFGHVFHAQNACWEKCIWVQHIIFY